jgi:hypothetical protein
MAGIGGMSDPVILILVDRPINVFAHFSAWKAYRS